MEVAFKAGVNLFDNAEAYAKGEAEKIMGEAICIGIDRGVWRREQLVVTTKIFFGTGAAGYNTKVRRAHTVVEEVVCKCATWRPNTCARQRAPASRALGGVTLVIAADSPAPARSPSSVCRACRASTSSRARRPACAACASSMST